MEQLNRVVSKALVFSTTHFGWWLLVLFQALGFYVTGWGVGKVLLRTGYFIPVIFGLFVATFVTARLWLEIQAEYEYWKEIKPELPGIWTSQFWRIFLGLAGLMAGLGVFLLAVKILLPHWAAKILVTSVGLVYILGIQLFWVIFRQSLIPAVRLSLDLWLKRAQVPAVCALVLMLGNGLAFSLARIGLNSLLAGGFSDFASSVRLWLLATPFLLLSVAILVWLNNFLVIGFLEFVRTQKGKDRKALADAACLAAAGK